MSLDALSHPDHTEPPAECIPATQLTTEDSHATDEPYKRLSNAQRGKILRLSAEGLTQSVIAAQIGTTQATVSRTLSAFADNTGLAKLRAKAASLEVVDASITQAKAGRAAHTKLMLQVAELIGQDASAESRVTVMIGMPGVTNPPTPLLEGEQVQDAESLSHDTE